MTGDRKALASAVCGGLSLVLPISILIALGPSRQQLATTSDWVFGTVIVTTLGSAVAAVVLGHLSLGYGPLLIPALLLTSAIAGRLALANTPLRTRPRSGSPSDRRGGLTESGELP